jgi:hypothetical protein
MIGLIAQAGVAEIHLQVAVHRGRSFAGVLGGVRFTPLGADTIKLQLIEQRCLGKPFCPTPGLFCTMSGINTKL